MTSRVVVASNRVPAPRGGTIPPGGLVSALGAVIQGCGEALWFGWSGAVGDPSARPARATLGGVEFATLDLREGELQGYYERYCNEVLWPAMHDMPERVHPEAEHGYAMYRAVNRRFARALAPMLREDDLIWVHDYHLIPLAEELRAMGFQGRIGYFHHVPIPGLAGWQAITNIDCLAQAMDAYDVIGVQTRADARRLRARLRAEAAARVQPFPISINPEEVRQMVRTAGPPPWDPGDSRTHFFGVDRLDYTKGIPDRLHGYALALGRRPKLREEAQLTQWAAPSRTSITEYRAERQAIEAAVTAVRAAGGRNAVTVSFAPHPREDVLAALAAADVCLVTSLADGMNLVAKEYAALHSAERPGVLVLSDGCGAAEELTDALIYPAGDMDALAECIERARDMPLDERRARAAALRAQVDTHTSGDWARAFLDELAATPSRRSHPSRGPARTDARELEEVR